MSAADSLDVCPVIKSFLARQSIVFAAGLIFLAYTGWRVHRGYEQRCARTLVADVSKQAGQQAIGGVLMLILGHRLSETGYSPLAWYGALYPFEIVLTTVFTGNLRRMNELYAARLARKRPAWTLVLPLARVGQYGPGGKGDWRWSWYRAQLLQATLFIGLPARLLALGLISLSVSLLPASISPCAGLAKLYFFSGLSCNQQVAPAYIHTYMYIYICIYAYACMYIYA